jgi:hypothetical protein
LVFAKPDFLRQNSGYGYDWRFIKGIGLRLTQEKCNLLKKSNKGKRMPIKIILQFEQGSDY